MTTCADLIHTTQRRLAGSARETTVVVSQAYNAGSTTLFVTDPNSGTALQALRPGGIIAVDLELMYVQNSVVSGDSATVTVAPGFQGSTEAAHAANALVYIDPKFSQFDVMQAINDDLSDLSSPDNGLYRVATLDLTYNPIYMGYDLAGVASGFLDVLELRYKLPAPSKNWPRIRKFSVLRSQTDSQFPSGSGIIIYEQGFPGLPIHVTYKAPFVPFANLTDDATAVAGLSSTMYDLPPLGAAILLVAPKEVKRNFIEAQPDPRKAQEVPPGAVMNSTAGVQRVRQARISAEASRLRRQYESYVQKAW